MGTLESLAILSPTSTRSIAKDLASKLGVSLLPIEEQIFKENGEYKYRPLENIDGKDVFIVHSIYGDHSQTVHDRLCEALFLAATIKSGLPKRITLIAPYLCYMRKDRQTEPHEPVMTKYVASLIESVAIDRVVTIEAHNLSAFQNAFRCSTLHLEVSDLFAENLAPRLTEPATVVSPDIGGVKRVEQFRRVLQERLSQSVGLAYMTKERRDSVQAVGRLEGDVKNRSAIIFDDIISSGTTMRHAMDACESSGAKEIFLAAAHGLFTDDAEDRLDRPALKAILISNTVRPFRLHSEFVSRKLEILDVSTLLANTVMELHGIDRIVAGTKKTGRPEILDLHH